MAHTRRICKVIGSYKWEWAVWGWKMTEKLKHQYMDVVAIPDGILSLGSPSFLLQAFQLIEFMNKDH